METTREDLKRDLKKDLSEFQNWGRGEPLLTDRPGWFKEAGEAAVRRAIRAEAELAKLQNGAGV
jgi:hypothetical protein